MMKLSGTDRVRTAAAWIVLTLLCACGDSGGEKEKPTLIRPGEELVSPSDQEYSEPLGIELEGTGPLPLPEEEDTLGASKEPVVCEPHEQFQCESAETIEEICVTEHTVNDMIGVGGGAGGTFVSKFSKRRSVRAGGRAVKRNPSHGGTHLGNDEAYDLQFFKSYGVHPMVDTDDDRFSTFAADVDMGAYTICRKFLDDGHLPKPEAVRVEEFVNYFDHDYAPPREGVFAAYMEGGPSPFAENRNLLCLGLKGREIDRANRKNAVLTFVIDVSGSMEQDNRLELVKKALRLLVDQLRPEDVIGIAVYGSEGKSLLAHCSVGKGKPAILEALAALRPGGSTNAEEGLDMGYDMADRAFRKGWINRVVLCSDGVANVGKTGPDSLFAKIEDRVKKGIFLTTVGFGMDNYNDVLMEQLGDKGNGRYAYVDDISEARRVFVEGLTGTLQVIAREVKIQVEFNPQRVRSYRLVGYENRDVADRDFRNDKVDGGEVGAGHAVTAVYELKMWEGAATDLPIGWFRVRYKHPDYGDKADEYVAKIDPACIVENREAVSDSFRLLSCVTRFAEILRKSHWAKEIPLAPAAEQVHALAARCPGNEKIRELDRLMAKTVTLLEKQEEVDKRQVSLNKVEGISEVE